MAGHTQQEHGGEGRKNITLRLGTAHIQWLKLEAARRVQSGEAARYDQSGVVRDALECFINRGGQEP